MKILTQFRRLLCLLLIGCLLLSGCAGNPAHKQTVSEQFDSFLEELFQEEAASDTITLHYTLAYPENYGITDYELTLGDLTVEAMEASGGELTELKEQLQSFDASQLTREQKLTQELLLDYVETELSVQDLYLYTEILGPTTGYQAQLPIVLAEYTFRTRQDIEDYLGLLEQIDDLFAQIVAFEEEKSRAGLFMKDSVADSIIGQCSAFIEDPENNYMIEVFDDKIASFEGLTEAEKETYSQRNRTLITTEVVAAYQSLIDGLTALKGTGTNEGGLAGYQDGARYYEYLVRVKTGSDDSVEELQARTEAVLESCITGILEVAMSNPEVVTKAYETAFPLSDPEEILEDLIGKIDADFPEIPEVGYTIKYVHPSMEEDSSPAFYMIPPIDDTQNNVIYINRLQTDDTTGNPLYPTLAHEGYPGHLYQNIYAYSNGLAPIRSLLSYPGYTEGWATYVEFYSYGISGMDPAIAEVRRQDAIFSLGMCAYLDMAIHHDGWEEADAAEYLASWGIGDDMAEVLYEVMLEEPGLYLSYFIGYMEFMDLRDQAESALGDAFALKEFHQFLLDMGPAPFYVIESYMTDWLASQQTAA